MLSKNPVTRISAGRRPQSEKTLVQKTYSIEEVNQALLALKDGPCEGLFRCMVFLGMRIGEVIALRWEQIDLEDSALWVTQTEAHIPTLMGDGTWISTRVNGSTKSNRKRKLHLSDKQIEYFTQHKRNLSKLRFHNGSDWNSGNYVFTTKNGSPFSANNVRKGINVSLLRNDVHRIRLHDLRHTAGFLAVEAGVAINDVQDMLGHADIGFTKDTYVGLVQAGSDRAIESLENHIVNSKFNSGVGKNIKRQA